MSKVRSTPSQSIPRNKVTPMMRKQKRMRKKKRKARKISILVPQSSDTEVVYTKGDDGEVMFIELIRKNDDSNKEEPDEEESTTTEGVGAEYFDIFPTRSELAYHKYLMCSCNVSQF
ncbi:hypothetical protein Tco_1509780 [Tanacetum coccineum]